MAGSLPNFDDQSCARATTLRSWLVGGAVEPRQGWGARGELWSLSRRPSGSRALPTSQFDKSHRLSTGPARGAPGGSLLGRLLDNATLARASMGTSLGFPLLFSALVVAVPLVL